MFWRSEAFERYAPVVFGFATLALIGLYRFDIALKFEPGGWDAAGLFGAVFNWASIQSGFVFGIYGFIVSKQDGFAGEVARGRSFDRLLAYARRAYLTGFVLTFVSLPIMVAGPSIADPNATSFLVVAVWFSAFVWTFCAFLRVAFIFGLIAAVPDRRPGIVG